MWPDRVSNLGPLALESEALLTAPRSLAINFVELEFQVLQTKFQGNLPSGYGEEDFLGFRSVAWSFGVQLVTLISFAPVFQWYCFTPWRSPGVTIRFCRVLISDSS